MSGLDFTDSFRSLTGNSPFRWQERLFAKFESGAIPHACDIPTGLGKTSVIVLWLLALAAQVERRAVHLPRRLVYVVDRRTVVDQASAVAVGLRWSGEE
ncbi:MAG TPA: hypothetical protein VNK52_01715 [Hyphomicrobiaceae bacterium]|nr:hypothetical protein [Hyphomicrobiaceae bacterium]